MFDTVVAIDNQFLIFRFRLLLLRCPQLLSTSFLILTMINNTLLQGFNGLFGISLLLVLRPNRRLQCILNFVTDVGITLHLVCCLRSDRSTTTPCGYASKICRSRRTRR